eukprot:scaffold659_cov329-Prasinococcus_capsulatus_cf.AAC.27
MVLLLQLQGGHALLWADEHAVLDAGAELLTLLQQAAQFHHRGDDRPVVRGTASWAVRVTTLVHIAVRRDGGSASVTARARYRLVG